LAYINFTDEQKRRAANVNLEEFLRRQGEKLIRSGSEKRLSGDHSVTVHGNRWYDHSAQIGGGPVSFVRERYNLSYPEAVAILLNGAYFAEQAVAPARKDEKPFALPPKHSDMRRAYAYLLNQRFVDREVITQFAREGLLYESAELSPDGLKEYHNAVFVGFDGRGVARHAHKRGLYSVGKAYKGNVYGSNPAYSFHRVGKSERLYVFEAPIDLMSFITLRPGDWQTHSYAALCGVSKHAMLKTLELNPHLKSIALCLDHDRAGIEAAARLRKILLERGYDNISVLQSQYKDWNEDLKARRGVTALPAEEHPQFEICGEVFRSIAARCEALPKSVKPENKLPYLAEKFRRTRSPELAETIAALALNAAVREYRQLGQNVTPAELAQRLQNSFAPNRRNESLSALERALMLSNAPGIRSAEQKSEQARAWLDAVAECAGVSIAAYADELTIGVPEQTNSLQMI
jgi:hypothetical protein